LVLLYGTIGFRRHFHDSMEQIMTRHLTRANLARGVAGAVSTLVLCATVVFTIARHFAL
jgi:hypothetical protein